MVEIDDIKDSESLQAWLETQPQKTSVAIAHRTAMRIFLTYWDWVLTSEYAQKHGLTVLVVSRCNLISGVAAFYPTPEISDKVKAAAAFVATAATAASAAASHSASSYSASYYDTAIAAAVTAATAATAAFTAGAAFTDDVEAVAFAAGFAAVASVIWRAIRADCLDLVEGRPLDQVALWRDEPNPYADVWVQIKTRLQSDPVDWSFWIKWYEASLNGQPLNPDMLEEIALIDSRDWRQGAAHVNALIAGIEKAYLLKATPLAERMELNPATGRLRVIPERMSQKTLYNNVLETVRDGMEDLRKSPQFTNALAALQPVFEDILDRTLTKYASSPQRVHDDFVKAKKRIQRLMDVGELSPDDAVIEFVDDLDKGAANIRANIPVVREAFAALAALRVAEASEADVNALQAGAEYVAQHSDPELAEEMREDSQTLVASRDVPEGAPPVLTPDSAYRLSSRLPRAESILSPKNVGKVIAGVGSGHTFMQVILRLFGL